MQLSYVKNLSMPALTLLLIALLSSYAMFLSNYNLYGLRQDSQKATVEASYLIWAEDSAVYARNGVTGVVEYSGEATPAINYAVSAANNAGGGLVFIKSGNYSLSGSIIMKSYVTLEGEGWGEQKAATILRLNEDVNDDVIKTLPQKNYHITIRNLMIEGNQANQKAGSGIHIYATDRPVIEYVVVKWCRERGIFIEGFGEQVSIAPQIRNVFIFGCGKEGIFVSATDAFIHNVDVGHDYLQDGTDAALHLYLAHKSIVAHSFFWGSKHGILIDKTNNALVSGCRIDYNRYDGVVLYCSSNDVVEGNQIIHNSQCGVGMADGIRLIGSEAIPCSNNTISNNFVGEENDFQQYHRYAIYEESPFCNNNCIIGNSVHCCNAEKIKWSGKNTIVYKNAGFITENSGIATGTSPIYVAHGLSVSPTCVAVSVYGTTTYQVSWVNYNSTHIVIYHNAGEGVAITITWNAIYKP